MVHGYVKDFVCLPTCMHVYLSVSFFLFFPLFYRTFFSVILICVFVPSGKVICVCVCFVCLFVGVFVCLFVLLFVHFLFRCNSVFSLHNSDLKDLYGGCQREKRAILSDCCKTQPSRQLRTQHSSLRAVGGRGSSSPQQGTFFLIIITRIYDSSNRACYHIFFLKIGQGSKAKGRRADCFWGTCAAGHSLCGWEERGRKNPVKSGPCGCSDL
jgi:hypothetical protein